MQALGTANMHTALRNGPGFLLQKRGKMLEWPECTDTLFPHTHRLLFVLSCNDFGKHSCVHNSRLLSCPLTMCPSNPGVPGEGAGATILPLRRHDPRGPCLSSGSRVLHIFPSGGWIRQHWGAARWAEPRDWALLFCLSPLFPFSGCLFWNRVLSPVKE